MRHSMITIVRVPNLVGIVLASDQASALANLAKWSPHPVELIGSVPATHRTYTALAAQLADYRFSASVWFEPNLWFEALTTRMRNGEPLLPRTRPGRKPKPHPSMDPKPTVKLTARILLAMQAAPHRTWTAYQMAQFLNDIESQPKEEKIRSSDCGRLMRANQRIKRVVKGKYCLKTEF